MQLQYVYSVLGPLAMRMYVSWDFGHAQTLCSGEVRARQNPRIHIIKLITIVRLVAIAVRGILGMFRCAAPAWLASFSRKNEICVCSVVAFGFVAFRRPP